MSRIAKTCCGCPACENFKCRLGYKQENYILFANIGATRPTECCRKPKNLSEFYNRLIEYEKNGVKL